MTFLVPSPSPPYIQPVAKKAAPQGNGPWGEAIQYWFKELHLRQAHVAEGTGLPPNTVSKAARGLDVHPATLRRIAEFFQVSFESVLVSPARRLSPTEERHVVEKLAADARRVMDQSRPSVSVRHTDPRLLGIAKRLGKLPPKLQKSAIRMIAEYEKLAKKHRGGRGAPSKAP